MLIAARLSSNTSDFALVCVCGSQRDFAAYDAAGTVLDTDQGTYLLVRAGRSQQVVGVGLDLADGAVVAEVNAQVEVPDSQVDESPASAMTASPVNVMADDYWPRMMIKRAPVPEAHLSTRALRTQH